MAHSQKAHQDVQVSHVKQLPRLKRIEGQVRGLQQMIENERDCVDITHQVSAVIAALRRVQGDMMREHLSALAEAAIGGGLSTAKARQLADEIGALMARMH